MYNKFEQNKAFSIVKKALNYLKPKYFAVCILLALTFATVQSVYSAVGIRETINFQGKLVNSAGLNVADGNYSVVFSLYTVSSGGTNIWQETQNVSTVDGLFRVELGSVSSLSSVNFNDDSLYLGIKVGADAEMTPRVRYTATPYAFQAKNVSWSGLQSPNANTSLSMAAYTTSLLYSGTSGSNDLFVLSSSANSTGTGRLMSLRTATDSEISPFHVSAKGIEALFVSNLGRVGIGTTSPGAALQVVGAITASGIISGTGSGLTNLNASNITSGTIPTASVVGAYGNITGVGTLTSLNVSGSITQEGSLSSITGTTFRSSLGSLGTPSYSFTGDINTGIFSPGADILGFVTSGTERMRIDASGNVGIGTASPVSKLSVTDETTIANRGITISQNTTDAAAALFNFRKSRGTAVSPTTVSNGDYTAAISTQNYDGSNYLFNGALGYRVNGTVTTNNVPSQWFFAASATTDNDPFANNTVRMVINSNGNVGIGTTNPSEQLEVSQSILIKGGLASGIKIDGSLIQRQTAGNALRFGVADAEVMRIQNGNVGIGTVSPSYKTEVAGANTGFWNGSTFTSTPMAMAISNTQPGGYDPVLMLQQTDSGGTIKNAGGIGLVGASNWAAGNNANQISNMYFLVRNNSGTISERMRITHDGNVGIGTASPGKTLHVAGSAKIGSGTSDAGGLLTINGGSNNQVNITHGNSNTWGLLLGYGDGTLTTDYHGNNHAAIVNVQNAPLHLGTFNNVRMTILGNGNVGIGTTSPGNLLTIAGSLTKNLTTGLGWGLMVEDTQTQALGVGGGIVFRGYKVSQTASANFGAIAGIKENNTSANELGSLLFYVNQGGAGNLVEVARISSSGNVGIGTTSPGSKFTVTNDIATGYIDTNTLTSGQWARISNPNTTSGVAATLLFEATGSGGGNGLGTISGVNTGSGSLALTFGTRDNMSNVIERVRIAANGNVGIGTTSPGGKLEVFNNVNDSHFMHINNPNASAQASSSIAFSAGSTIGEVVVTNQNYNYSINYGTEANTLQLINRGAGPLIFKTAGYLANAERMRITSNGNVGIGTTSPGTIFNVGGTTNKSISVDSSSNRAYYGAYNDAAVLGVNRDPATGSFFSTSKAASYIAMSGGASNGYIDFFATNVNNSNPPVIMRVAGNGNVGIGTVSPSSQLDIFGTTAGLQLSYDANDYGRFTVASDGALTLSGVSGGGALTNIARYSTSQINMDVPTSFNSAGDVSMAYDLYLSNQTASAIKSDGPLTIQSGEAFENLNLTLKASGQGNLIVQSKNIWADGTNVGIGTTSPVGKLHIGATTGVVSPGSIALSIRDASSPTYGFDFNLEGVSTGDLSLMRTVLGTQSQVMTFQRSSGNVGIGTTSPTSILSVTDGVTPYAASTGVVIDTRRAVINGTDNARVGLRLSNNSNAFSIFYGGTSDRLRFMDGANKEVMSLLNGGNVGIGTTAPGNTLTIGQNTASNNTDYSLSVLRHGTLAAPGTYTANTPAIAVIDISGDGPATAETQALLNVNAARIADTDTYAANAMLFNVQNDTGSAFTIKGNRNVGIGTANPTLAKLDVNQSSGISPGSAIKFGSHGFLVSPATIISHNGYWTGSAWANVSNATSALLSLQGDITFRTAVATAGTPTWEDRLTILNSNGNVGIGTASPGVKLDVNGQIRSYAPTGEIYSRSTNANNTAKVFAGWTDNSGMQIGYLPQTAQGYVENTYPITAGQVFGDIYFRQNNAGTMVTRMTIKADGGNVGIGTTNPQQIFSVYDSRSYTAIGLHNDFSNGARNWALIADSVGAFLIRQSDSLMGDPVTGTARFYINSSGNVGIGTDNPSARLQVAGPATGSGITLNVGGGGDTVLASGGSLFFDGNYSYATGNYIRPIAANTQTFVTSGIERMRITSAGNVGIGTTNPSQALHVTGRIRMDTWTADGDAVAYRDAATNSIALITSDIRLKKDIIPIRSGLEVINQIGAYMYHELDENITDKYRLGVMAQELMPLMPELVYSFSRTGTSETFYSVHYDKLAVLLLKGIQEQQLQIEAQSSALQALDPKILDLENTLAQIELERVTAVSQEEGGTAFENLYSIVEDTVSRVVSLENSVAEILSRIDSLVAPQISASDSARIEDLSQRMSFVEAMFMGELATGLNSTASAQLAMSISENEIIFDRKVVAEGDLSVLGETNLGDVGVTGNITNNMLVINGFDESLATPGASLNTLAGALNIQSSGLNSINFVDGSFKMDTDGNFIIHKGNLEVSMGSVKGNDGIRGINVSVGQSQVEMRVNFKAKNDTENYAVGISPSWFTNFLVSGKDENGFTVKFSTPAPQGAKFDWIVIE